MACRETRATRSSVGRAPRALNALAPCPGFLTDALQTHDRQVLASVEELDFRFHLGARLAPHERPRSRARRRSRPPLARLEPGSAIRGMATEVDLVGCATAQGRMRPVFVVPVEHALHIAPKDVTPQRHERDQAEQT